MYGRQVTDTSAYNQNASNPPVVKCGDDIEATISVNVGKNYRIDTRDLAYYLNRIGQGTS